MTLHYQRRWCVAKWLGMNAILIENAGVLLIVIREKQMPERIRRPLGITPQTPNPMLLSKSLTRGSVYLRRVENISEYVNVPARRCRSLCRAFGRLGRAFGRGGCEERLRFKSKNDIVKVAYELWVSEKCILPHVGNFFRRVPETRPESKTPNAEIGVAVVNCNAKCSSNLVFHKFFFLLERVLFPRAVKFWSFHWADGYYREC